MKRTVIRVGVVVGLLVILWTARIGYIRLFERHAYYGRPLYKSLTVITIAQLEFRANHKGENGHGSFWRDDIAGLYALKGPDDVPIKLIELSIAVADAHPTTDIDIYATRSSKDGYLFKTLRHTDETKPDPNRYAACAFPEKYSESERFTYVIDERNVVFKRDLGRAGGVDIYPDSIELARHWTKMD